MENVTSLAHKTLMKKALMRRLLTLWKPGIFLKLLTKYIIRCPVSSIKIKKNYYVETDKWLSQVTAVQLFYRVADRNKVVKCPKKHLFRSPFYAKSILKQVSSKHFQKPFLTALGKCFHYLETFENCNKFPISNRLTIDCIVRLSKPPTLYRIKDLLVIPKKVFVAFILGKGTFSSISDSYGSKYWRKYCLSWPSLQIF